MQNGAGGAIRTRTPLQTTRFELVTYTIPSLRHNKWRRVEDSNPWASSRRPPLSKRLLWATQPTLLMKQWRKGWDSNPRRFFKPQPFSRRQPSTGLGHPSVIIYLLVPPGRVELPRDCLTRPSNVRVCHSTMAAYLVRIGRFVRVRGTDFSCP